MQGLRVTGLSRVVNGPKRPVSVVAPWTSVVASGTCLALTGPADSGVRSALRLVAGLDRPSSGTVEVLGDAGRVLADASDLRNLRRHVLHLPALEYLFAVDPDGVRARFPAARSVASDCGLDPASAALEAARLWESSVVLVDAGGLFPDASARRRFTEGVRALKGDGRAVVLVGQDERVLAAVADRVEVWLDGVVVGDGAPEGFLGAAIGAARAEGLL